MKPTPFNPETDYAPIPFTDEVCRAAKTMKDNGLSWQPHVGCFVWDADEHIQVSSPFPHRIYFILNLGHFLKRFGTVKNIADKLVWLPTWHQARLLCREFGVSEDKVRNASSNTKEALISLYTLICESL
jgi:hypothetical protein